MNITVDVDDSGLRAVLGKLSGAGSNLSGLMEILAEWLKSSTDRRFEKQQDPEGNPWPPSIRALAEGGNTLTDSGRLVRSIQPTHGQNFAEVGTNVIYAAIHQFGGKITAKDSGALRFKIGDRFVNVKSVTIPARPYLGIGARDIPNIQQQVEGWLSSIVEGAS